MFQGEVNVPAQLLLVMCFITEIETLLCPTSNKFCWLLHMNNCNIEFVESKVYLRTTDLKSHQPLFHYVTLSLLDRQTL